MTEYSPHNITVLDQQDSNPPRRVTLLGSTGSIGTQAMDVIAADPSRFEVVGLSASTNSELLLKQMEIVNPSYVALENGDPSSLEGRGAKVLSGPGSSSALAAIEADIVLNGIVGFAGLAATVSCLEAGNRLALANKESVVAGGEWVMGLAEDNPIIPVDSEHSAIFQCLAGRDEGLAGVLLTASGGPFFESDEATIRSARVEDALKHPTWSMGVKNTLDSATMMNKGLEVIEAHHLFGVAYDDIKVVVHRQSVVHGGVTLDDGAVILHASPPDMRLAISYGMLYPERVDIGLADTDFDATKWTFDEPRNDLFRCLPLAYEAGRAGGTHPISLNAANEVAVEAFIEGRIGFTGIADLIEEVLASVDESGEPQSMEDIRETDQRARKLAVQKLGG